MLGAIYTGMSGMNAFSDGLQTVSNNVANLNTDGFKSTNVMFSELLNTQEGGSVSRQNVGNGVELDSPTTDFSQGTLQQTDSGLDLAIQGSGYLVVYNDGTPYLTRTGSFSLDSTGHVATQQGDQLAVLDANNQPKALDVSSLETSAPVATTSVSFANNLSSSGTTATVSNIDVYDSTGAQHVWTAALSNPTPNSAGTGTNWTVTVTDSTGTTVGTGTIGFIGGTADPSNDTVAITQSITGGADLDVSLNFSNVTSFSSGTASTLSAGTIDGHAAGTLTGVSVDTNGVVQIAYSNGQTQAAGSVAMANVQDQQNLQLLPGGLYKLPSGGKVQYFANGAEGLGTLESSELEASNVNLSNEFGDLILIERGYQACSEVVSIANDMIQNLFSIRGQGA